MANSGREDTFGRVNNRDEKGNDDADMFGDVTGLAMTGGPSGVGITGKTIAGPDLQDDVVGNPLNADYTADRRTNVTGNDPGDNETDTTGGFAGEGGANPDAGLPPRAR